MTEIACVTARLGPLSATWHLPWGESTPTRLGISLILEGLALTDRLFRPPNQTSWAHIRFSEVPTCAGLVHALAPPTRDWVDALGGDCLFLRPDETTPDAFWLGVRYGLPGGRLLEEVGIVFQPGAPQEVRLEFLRKQYLYLVEGTQRCIRGCLRSRVDQRGLCHKCTAFPGLPLGGPSTDSFLRWVALWDQQPELFDLLRIDTGRSSEEGGHMVHLGPRLAGSDGPSTSYQFCSLLAWSRLGGRLLGALALLPASPLLLVKKGHRLGQRRLARAHAELSELCQQTIVALAQARAREQEGEETRRQLIASLDLTLKSRDQALLHAQHYATELQQLRVTYDADVAAMQDAVLCEAQHPPTESLIDVPGLEMYLPGLEARMQRQKALIAHLRAQLTLTLTPRETDPNLSCATVNQLGRRVAQMEVEGTIQTCLTAPEWQDKKKTLLLKWHPDRSTNVDLANAVTTAFLSHPLWCTPLAQGVDLGRDPHAP